MSHPALLGPIEALAGPLRTDPTPILSAFTRRELGRGERWLAVGQVARKIAFLESGLLRHHQAYEGRAVTRWATLPGQYAVSLPSFVRRQPSDVTIEAAAPSVVYEVDRDRWLSLRAEVPQLQTFWIAVLEYQMCCFEDRVWSLIAGDGEARYRYMIERYPDFLLALPQHYLADMLGLAPRHLSRIRNKLATEQR